MGQSQLADALTGLAIPRGERVVTLVVDRRRGGYPDATTHAAIPGLSPSQAFEPVSLPVRGKAGSYGDIEPSRDDLGARLMLHLANKPSWADLSAAAFGVDGSVVLGEAAHGLAKTPWSNPADREPRTLGFVAFHSTSWDTLVALGSRGREGRRDVDTVLAAIEVLRAGDNDLRILNHDLTRLASSNAYARNPDDPEDIVATRLPDLARALSTREDGNLLSTLATRWFGRSRVLGPAMLDVPEGPRLRTLLERVGDLQSAERGMGILCRAWQPSYGAGQHDNAVEVAEAAVDSFARATDQALAAVEEGMDGRSLPRIEAVLARLDGVRNGLAERLDAVRGTPSPAP